MRYLLFIFSIFCSTAVLAQDTKGTTTVTRTRTMTGAELKNMFHITDRTIYDREGKVIDSVTADKMVRSMEYGINLVSQDGKEFKRILI